MPKLKIFLYHLLFFILGSVGIAVYVFERFTAPGSAVGLGGIIAMPAIILIYVAAFGILCFVSFLIWLLVFYLRARKIRQK